MIRPEDELAGPTVQAAPPTAARTGIPAHGTTGTTGGVPQATNGGTGTAPGAVPNGPAGGAGNAPTSGNVPSQAGSAPGNVGANGANGAGAANGNAPSGNAPSGDVSTKERILAAAEELFAEHGFDVTPTSQIAERAGVPKGLVHYYFRRKADLLVALIERLPDERVERDRVVVPGDVAASLRRLVAQLDARLDSSRSLSHLLWREADTHHAVRDALQARYRRLVRQIRSVITAARGGDVTGVDVHSAAELLALAVSYRHSVARHDGGCAGQESTEPDPTERMDREVDFVADALLLGAGSRH